jgi:hypothetical protein
LPPAITSRSWDRRLLLDLPILRADRRRLTLSAEDTETPQTHQARGLILKLLRAGLVVVPFREHTNVWDAVVVDCYGAYPVGGYDVHVSTNETETAIESQE